jgi:hypothetical protein
MPAERESIRTSVPRRAKRPAARWVAAVVVVVLAVWRRLQVFGPYSRPKSCVKWQIGTERLQAWAVETLRDPLPAAAGPSGAINRKHLSEDTRSLASRGFVVFVEARNGVQEHVLFACGGGFYHYGLRVGAPGFRPAPDGQFGMEKIADGVLGMYER